MIVEQVFDGTDIERLGLLEFGEVKETVWRSLSLQGFEPPSTSIVTRILFLARMILKPFQSLWTLCFHLLFLVEPENCPVCAKLRRGRREPHLLLHCPRCGAPMHSSGTNGRNPVFVCPKHGRISIRRTLEARIFFALYALRVGQLVAAGIPEKEAAELLGVTRTFIETAVRTLATRLNLPPPQLKGELIVLFLDGFYGSRLAILVGKAGKHVLWTFGEENTMNIRSFLRRIEKSVPEGATLVVVTDGKADYIDPVRSIFPDCIHVRHFHNTWNEVIVHYPLEDQVYSLHGPIDMLQRRKTARVTVWKGVRVNPPRPRKAEIVLDGELGKLFDMVTLINANRKYDGRLLQRFTRVLRRLAALTSSGEIERRDVEETLKLLRMRKLSLRLRSTLRARIEEFRSTQKPQEKTAEAGREGDCEDGKPYVERRNSTRVFEGTLEGAEECVRGVKPLVRTLSMAFGSGKLVSSPVEGVNSNIKPLISSKSASKPAVKLALLNRFSHIPLLRIEAALPLSTSVIVRERRVHVHPHQLITMRYTDRNGRATLRTVYTLSVSGGRVRACCFLRKGVRTFLRSRMEILQKENIPLSP